MKLLAFDTSTSACSVAVLNSTLSEDRRIVAKQDVQAMQQGKLILPLIEAALHDAEVSLHELDAIAFGQGPGSYTGTRIATSVAQGLGSALSCPLIPLSSLQIIAQSAYLQHGWQSIQVAIDARVGEIYAASYQLDANGIMAAEDKEQVISPNALIIPFKETEWWGVGNGWTAYGEILNSLAAHQPQAIDENQQPQANALVMLAKNKLELKQYVSLDEALPVYLR